MHRIHVRAGRAFRNLVNLRHLRQAALLTLRHEKLTGDAELTFVITDDEAIRNLNRQYRHIDASTDVLSFGVGAERMPLEVAPGESAYLGDVIISYPRARAQAESRGHGVDDELVLLVVHGVLHLLGHDHATAREKRRMWAVQAQILAESGVHLDVAEQ